MYCFVRLETIEIHKPDNVVIIIFKSLSSKSPISIPKLGSRDKLDYLTKKYCVQNIITKYDTYIAIYY